MAAIRRSPRPCSSGSSHSVRERRTRRRPGDEPSQSCPGRVPPDASRWGCSNRLDHDTTALRDFRIRPFFWRATRLVAEAEVVTRTRDGSPRHRDPSHPDPPRVRSLANALSTLGVDSTVGVGTIGWTPDRHFESYFALRQRPRTSTPSPANYRGPRRVHHRRRCRGRSSAPSGSGLRLLERIRDRLGARRDG